MILWLQCPFSTRSHVKFLDIFDGMSSGIDHVEGEKTDPSIEQFILGIMVIVGLATASITTTVEILTYKEINRSVLIDFFVILVLLASFILWKRNLIVLAAMLGISSLLLSMTIEIAASNFFRQGSLAVILVLSFSNSVVLTGLYRWIMHGITFLTLFGLLIYLNVNGFELPDGSSFISMTINVLLVYALLGFISYNLKERYDRSIGNLNSHNKDLQEAMETLKSTQSRLIESEKMASLGILTKGISHEINNPLNYIRGATVNLKQLLDTNSGSKADVDEMLKILETGVEKAERIVHSLNDFSRGNSKLDESCNIHQIVENSLVMLTSQLDPWLVIEKQFMAENFRVKGNPGQLHQVLINILVNAIQAIAENGGITISTLNEGSNLILRVRDNGSGIPSELIEKVKDPFFTTKDPGDGTGLGLSISSNIVEDHGGHLKIDSVKDSWTLVEITLPVDRE